MSSGTAMNPSGGANSGTSWNEIPSIRPARGLGFTIRLRPDDFYEPPRADPHAWWCGEGRLEAVPYPIRGLFYM